MAFELYWYHGLNTERVVQVVTFHPLAIILCFVGLFESKFLPIFTRYGS